METCKGRFIFTARGFCGRICWRAAVRAADVPPRRRKRDDYTLMHGNTHGKARREAARLRHEQLAFWTTNPRDSPSWLILPAARGVNHMDQPTWPASPPVRCRRIVESPFARRRDAEADVVEMWRATGADASMMMAQALSSSSVRAPLHAGNISGAPPREEIYDYLMGQQQYLHLRPQSAPHRCKTAISFDASTAGVAPLTNPFRSDGVHAKATIGMHAPQLLMQGQSLAFGDKHLLHGLLGLSRESSSKLKTCRSFTRAFSPEYAWKP